MTTAAHDALAERDRLAAEVADMKAAGNALSQVLGEILGSHDSVLEKSHERDGNAAIDVWNDLTEESPEP